MFKYLQNFKVYLLILISYYVYALWYKLPSMCTVALFSGYRDVSLPINIYELLFLQVVTFMLQGWKQVFLISIESNSGMRQIIFKLMVWYFYKSNINKYSKDFLSVIVHYLGYEILPSFSIMSFKNFPQSTLCDILLWHILKSI